MSVSDIRPTSRSARIGLQVLIASMLSGCLAGPHITTPTIWQKIGIPQGFSALADNRINRRGNFSGAERKPPVRRIADERNLDPESIYGQNNAIKNAAMIKQQEDLAPQKIKALKYLATIGCGCYDKDGKVEAAILAGLDDCTEDVRTAAIEALEELVGRCCDGEQGVCGPCCEHCCTEKIQKRLAEMAFEEKNGCPIEPSADVREAARRALCLCPNPTVDEPDEPAAEVEPEVDDPEARDDEADDPEANGSAEDIPAPAEEGVAARRTSSAWPSRTIGSQIATGRFQRRTTNRSGQETAAAPNEFVLVSDSNRTGVPTQVSSTDRPKRRSQTRAVRSSHANQEAVRTVSELRRIQTQTARPGYVVDGVVEMIDRRKQVALVALKRQVNVPKGVRIECAYKTDGQAERSVQIKTVKRSQPGLIAVGIGNSPNAESLRSGTQLTIRVLGD